jgi:Ser/Thr protein kinase RdoA (MazF antagonist)
VTVEALAAAALRHWGPVAVPACLIKARENVVFEVRLADGRHGALRLHRPGYQAQAAIESELDWCAGLVRTGFPVPGPMATLDGRWTCEAGDRVASCVSWMEGTALGHAGRPLEGPAEDQTKLYFGVGRLIGRLHAATDGLPEGTGRARPVWDAAGLLGEAPLWGRFWENPAFSAAERAEIEAARARAARRLAELRANGGDFGLIHADVLRENILVREDGLALIDFDDSGWGFRLYDLGTALVQNLEEPAFGAIARSLAEGYRSVRPTPAFDAADLMLFTMLRAFASAGWIMTRAAPDDPRQRLYPDRALRLARLVRAGSVP